MESRSHSGNYEIADHERGNGLDEMFQQGRDARITKQQRDDTSHNDMDYVDIIWVAVEFYPDPIGLISLESEGLDQRVHKTVKGQVEGERYECPVNHSGKKEITRIEDNRPEDDENVHIDGQPRCWIDDRVEGLFFRFGGEDTVIIE